LGAFGIDRDIAGEEGVCEELEILSLGKRQKWPLQNLDARDKLETRLHGTADQRWFQDKHGFYLHTELTVEKKTEHRVVLRL